MSGILLAGIGNIFNGDDGFGVEVARQLARRALPPGVRVTDFGVRGLDLAYALLEDWSAVVLIDAAQRGEPPGTIYVVEHEWEEDGAAEHVQFSPHELDPAKVLAFARDLGAVCRRVFVVACEPLTFGGEDGNMGLSEPVEAAVEPAIAAVDELLRELVPAAGHVFADTMKEGSTG